MPKFSVDHVGEVGIVHDLAPYRLQPNAWTGGQNITFEDDKVLRKEGSEAIWPGVNMAPFKLMFQPTEDELFWIAAGEQRIKVFDGTVWTDISRAALYNASRQLRWNGGLFGGLAVLNNGIDPPQYWATPSAGTLMADLPNWPVNTVARVMRPFGSFLIGGNITKSGVVYAHMIKWSHRADPGTIPSSWDHTDAALDAGETNLIDTFAGPIMDFAPLGASMFVYKQGAIHEMSRTRDFNIFDIQPRFQNVGILGTNCVSLIPRKPFNFLMTGDDLVTHDARSMDSIIDRRWRKWLSEEMAFEASNLAFTVTNPFHNECWFCFPEVGADWCTKALIWNYSTNTLGVRDLDNISCAAAGTVLLESDSWDSAVSDWDSDTASWNILNFGPRKTAVLLGDPINEQVLHGSMGNQIGGVDLEASIERTALAIVGQDLKGNYRADPYSIKVAQRIWIRAKGGPFNVQLGAHDEERGTVTWDTALEFDPSTDQFVDPTEPPNGRYLAVKFSSTGGEPWEIEGYDLELEVLGQF